MISIEKTITIDKVLKELAKIRLMKFNDGSYLLNPITKKQRDILELFNLKPEDINNSIEKV